MKAPNADFCPPCKAARGFHIAAVNRRIRPDIRERKRAKEKEFHEACIGPDSCTCNHDMTDKEWRNR